MKTIVWDVDDVLNDLMRAWFEDWRSSAGAGCTLAYDRITRNPPHELLGIAKEEYLASLDDFRLSGKAARLPPVAEMLKWFSRFGDGCHHVALTAVPLHACHVSAEWVMRNFGRWIRSFNVIPSPRPGTGAARHHPEKSDFLRWWGKGDIMVDDSPRNIAGAEALGLQTVLVPRPWNGSARTLPEALAELAEMVSSAHP